MKRREFIKGSAVIALAAGTGQGLKAASMLDGGPLQALQEAEAAGISYGELCEKIIEIALRED